MALSNTYGNTPRPLHEGREVPDRDAAIPAAVPDCVAAVAEARASCEAASSQLSMDMGGPHG